MSINKQAKLIDGQALLEDMKEKKRSLRDSLNFAKREGEDKWADELREQMQIYTDYIEAIESGRFDAPSESDGEWKAISEIVQRENEQLKAENDRLRAALDGIRQYLMLIPNKTVSEQRTIEICNEALSTTTEPTGAERVRELWALNTEEGNRADEEYLSGIVDTLNALGIIIPGINAPDGVES